MKILYVLYEYPQLSQTYIKTEIEALKARHEVEIISLGPPDLAYQNHQPFQVFSSLKEIVTKIHAFKPDVIHSHWLQMAPVLYKIARKTKVPYTIRAHSFDVLSTPFKPTLKDYLSRCSLRYLIDSFKLKHLYWRFNLGEIHPSINNPYCLGILAFPFARSILTQLGVKPHQIIDCYPVIDYAKFVNDAPNGAGVMNVGACIPKKKMENFIDLSLLVPSRKFTLYSIGYQSKKIAEYNESKGSPVEVLDAIEPDLMPVEYKKNQWLVYTADFVSNTVGWSVSVAEAQAAGVGVCFPNLREDLNGYLGGAGILYDSIHDIAEIIKQDVPTEMREKGFEVAKRSDIQTHLHLLESLWAAKPA
jgi:Glycosyltransferase Family 4